MSSQSSEEPGTPPDGCTGGDEGAARRHTPVPEPVRALVRRSVPSHEALECLVLLARERCPLAVSAICARVDFPRARTVAALRGLDEAGLVMSSTGRNETFYCYAPADDQSAVVEDLLEMYRHDVVEIVKLMTANSLDRMHSRTSDMLAGAVLAERLTDPERPPDR